MLGLGGVTWIDASVAAVTASDTAGDTIPPRVALTLVDPMPAAGASPVEPDALLIVATAGSEDDQVTVWVRSDVVLSVYVPVAVNCCVRPFAMLALGGATWIDTRLAGVTLSVADGKPTRPEEAVMLLEPIPMAVAK